MDDRMNIAETIGQFKEANAQQDLSLEQSLEMLKYMRNDIDKYGITYSRMSLLYLKALNVIIEQMDEIISKMMNK